jgi:predicted RNase H-like nuclease (RuvC/YqgF family)
MDTKFLTYFNEVAQDNFIAVVKQNLVFQAQLKLLDDEAKKIPGLLETIENLEETKKEVQGFIEEVTDLKNQLEHKDTIIRNNSNSDADKHRIQTALNTQAQEIQILTNKLAEAEKASDKKNAKLEQQVNEQKEYIAQLEEMLPNSKKKKLGIAVEVPVTTEIVTEEKLEDTPKIDDDKLKIQSSGGTF